MKLTISTTPEQDKAITILNEQNHQDKDPILDEDYALLLLSDYLNSIVKSVSDKEADDTLAIFFDKFSTLSDEDKATLIAIADKLAGQ